LRCQFSKKNSKECQPQILHQISQLKGIPLQGLVEQVNPRSHLGEPASLPFSHDFLRCLGPATPELDPPAVLSADALSRSEGASKDFKNL